MWNIEEYFCRHKEVNWSVYKISYQSIPNKNEYYIGKYIKNL